MRLRKAAKIFKPFKGFKVMSKQNLFSGIVKMGVAFSCFNIQTGAKDSGTKQWIMVINEDTTGQSSNL